MRNNDDDKVIKRAKDILAFIVLTCKDDIDLEYSAVLTVITQFFFEIDDIDETNKKHVLTMVNKLNGFIEQYRNELIVMSN